MKKFTLLALGALLAAPMGFAQEAEGDLPGGLKTSTAENPIYYKIANMRSLRLSYIDGQIYDAEGEPIEGRTNGSYHLPYWCPGENGVAVETPEVWTMPYMGLAKYNEKFWCAFSAQPQVMAPETIYWWFEKGTNSKSVYIHNAVITDGVLNSKPDGKFNNLINFTSTTKPVYYVVPLSEDEIESIGLEEDPVFGTNAYTLASTATISSDRNAENGKTSLNVQNFTSLYFGGANYRPEFPLMNEDMDYTEATEAQLEVLDGDDQDAIDSFKNNYMYIEDEDIWVKKATYGFVPVQRNWSPIITNDGPQNETYNNGSLFTVEEEIDIEKVNAAIESYKKVIIESYKAGAVSSIENLKKTYVNKVKPLANVPALYDATKLDGIIAQINAYTANTDAITSLADAEAIEETADAALTGLYNAALSLAGNNTVVTIKNMLGLRDWATVADDQDVAEEYQLGNAFLTSDAEGGCKYSNEQTELPYAAIGCTLVEGEATKWTMEWVNGEGYRLKNGNNYIRMYGDFEPLLTTEQWSELLDVDPDELDTDNGETILDGTTFFTWALTENVEEAAVFTLNACANPANQTALDEAKQSILEDYYEFLGFETEEEATSITNNVRLSAPDVNGNNAWLFRDNNNNNYRIINYTPEGNRWYAESGCWNIKLEKEGEVVENGISEINAGAKAAGIFDLQGRKVAKAGKGLYIINGVKTVVK